MPRPLSHYYVHYKCKKKTWKGEMIKNKLQRGERSDSCITQICRLLWSVVSPENRSFQATQFTSALLLLSTSAADERHNAGWKFLFSIYLLDFLRSAAIFRYELGRCHFFLLFNFFFLLLCSLRINKEFL